MSGTKQFVRKPIKLTIKDDDGTLCHLSIKPSGVSARWGGEPTYRHLPIKKVVAYIVKNGREITEK